MSSLASCDEYLLYPGVCSIPAKFSSGNILINDVTRFVCFRLCSDVYDADCSSFIFNRKDSSCILSAYTGEWLPLDAPNCANNSAYASMEFYRRKRCIGSSDISCNFEDESCMLTQTVESSEKWATVAATSLITIPFDNTLNLAIGHFQLMMTTDLRLGYFSRLQSLYINTTDRCIELYFWIDSDIDDTHVSVMAISEEKNEATVVRTFGRQTPGWTRLFSALPSGIYRIVVEGRRGSVGYTEIAVDDIFVRDCKQFVLERECRVNPMGTGYVGSMTIAASGDNCLRWSDVNVDFDTLPLDIGGGSNENYCRNVIGPNATSQPFCYIATDSEATLRDTFADPLYSDLAPQNISMCNIRYCDCRFENYFRCKDGLCIPQQLTCNGVNECSDGDDENADLCSNRISVTCDFEDAYLCGYKLNILGRRSWSRIKASDSNGISSESPITDASGALNGYYMWTNTGCNQLGEKMHLISPLVNISQPRILRFSFSMPSADNAESASVLRLLQYSRLHFPVELRVNVIGNEGNRWQSATSCLFFGSYFLVFEATMSNLVSSMIAIDNIQLSDESCEIAVRPTKEKQKIKSVNCTFSGSYSCGYDIIATSSLLRVSYAIANVNPPKAAGTDYCTSFYYETTGFIEPLLVLGPYCPTQIYHITASVLSTISFTFTKLALLGECHRYYIQIDVIDSKTGDWIPYLRLCNFDLPLKQLVRTTTLRMTVSSKPSFIISISFFKVVYTISTPEDTDCSLVLLLDSPFAVGTVADEHFTDAHVARLISPVFQMTQISCLTIIFTAQTTFFIKLGYLNGNTYHEKLIHRNLASMGNLKRFLTIKREMELVHADDYQFVLMFEYTSVTPRLKMEIDDVHLATTRCTDIQDAKVWNGNCSTENDLPCGFTDVSESGYSWSLSQNIGVYASSGFRSEFDGSSSEELSVLLSAPVRLSTAENMCLEVRTRIDSAKILLNVSLLLPDAAASSSQTIDISIIKVDYFGTPEYHDYFIHTTYDGPVRLQITAYRQGFASGGYSSALIYDTHAALCPNKDILMNASSKCMGDNRWCHSKFGANWYMALAGKRLVQPKQIEYNYQELQWSAVSEFSYNRPTTRDYMSSVIVSPPISINSPVSLLLSMNLEKYSDTIVYHPEVKRVFFEIYVASSLGILQYRLLSLIIDTARNLEGSTCLPQGSYRLAFYANDDSNDDEYDDLNTLINKLASGMHFELSNVTITKRPCIFDDIAGLCPNSNICMDRVISLSTQFIWRFVFGRSFRIEGKEEYVILVYDQIGNLYMPAVWKMTTVYLMAPAELTVSLTISTGNQEAECKGQFFHVVSVGTDDDFHVKITSLDSFADSVMKKYKSVRMLELSISAVVAKCINTISYHIDTPTSQGYSLRLLLNTAILGRRLDNLPGQWISDLLTVAGHSVLCLSIDLMTSSTVQIQHYQESTTGNASIHTIFESGSGFTSEEMILGKFQLALVDDIYRTQIIIRVNKSTTINDVHIEFDVCQETVTTMNWNVPCDFETMSHCGFRDATEDEYRWVVSYAPSTLSYTSPDDGNGRVRECLSNSDGRNYIGHKNRTITGRACLPWNSQQQQLYYDIAYFADSLHQPSATLDDIVNYCRNPSVDGTYRPRPWCYTQNMNTEFCLILLCQDFYLNVVFGKELYTAVLLAPLIPYNNSTKSCLQFQYRLSDVNVVLRLEATATEAIATFTLSNLNYQSQANTSDWNNACAQINNKMRNVKFVAEKIGYTAMFSKVAIRNIVLRDSPCLIQDKSSKATDGEMDYEGPRRPIASFTDLVMSDNNRFTSADVMVMLGHKKENLIYSCSWNNLPCTDADISTELTDMGLCYTFNGRSEHTQSSSNAGAKYGLRLTLNVERYENIPGHATKTGVKLHLRKQYDIPQALDSGFAISPGFQTLAPLDHVQMTNLRDPWGNCNEKNYEFFNSTDSYTTAKCQMECETRSIINRCHCKSVYMPGPAQICSLGSYLLCANQNVQNMFTGLCDCPESCNMSTYATSLSFSKLSGSGVGSSLWETGHIRPFFMRSLEISSRVQPDVMSEILNELEEIIRNHKLLQNTIYEKALNPATSIASLIREELSMLISVMEHDYWTSQGTVGDCRSCYDDKVSHLIQDLTGHLTSTNIQLFLMQSKGRKITMSDLNRFRRLMRFTLELIESTIHALRTSEAVDGYVSVSLSEDWQILFCPASCLEHSCLTEKDALVLSIAQKVQQVEATIFADRNVRANGSTSIRKTAGTTDPRYFNMDAIDFVEIRSQIAQLINCMAKYSDFLKLFESVVSRPNLDFTVNAIDTSAVIIAMNRLSQDSVWLEDILVKYRENKITKQELCETLLQETSNRLLLNVEGAVSSVESAVVTGLLDIISAIETRGITFYHQLILSYSQLTQYIQAEHVIYFAKELYLWKHPISMPYDKALSGFKFDKFGFEQTFGMSASMSLLKNQSQAVLTMIFKACDSILKNMLDDLKTDIRSIKQNVINNITSLTNRLTSFNDTTVIVDEFIRNNFLEVDIFFGELSYRTITQKTGYDIIQFLSDFGGSLGLFLGGSILSIFEFLDLLIYNHLVKLSMKQQRVASVRVY